jgi:hypothetical protein
MWEKQIHLSFGKKMAILILILIFHILANFFIKNPRTPKDLRSNLALNFLRSRKRRGVTEEDEGT